MRSRILTVRLRDTEADHLARAAAKRRESASDYVRRVVLDSLGIAEPAVVPRCDCKAMTLKRAQARGRSSEHKAGCAFAPPSLP